jgi:hypothetical protein
LHLWLILCTLTVAKTLEIFNITNKLGNFVLDNAYANDTAIAKLGELYGFEPRHRRLRCGPHTLNLIGQMLIFGYDAQAYNNNADEHKTETAYLREWRQNGPLGVLIDIINYIKTPQQHNLFADFQRRDSDTPLQAVLEPVKPVITRWNSFYDCFTRAVQLHLAVNAYAQFHIERTKADNVYARSRNNQLPRVPAWTRSDGLSAADWAVINEYIQVLQPLKEATKRLEARSKGGRFGAIYEVIPVFEAVLNLYEQLLKAYDDVDYSPADTPEDHLPINLRAAWAKANRYYAKLDDSPAYYAAVYLHAYYKHYCENSWRDKSTWVDAGESSLRQLWAEYKPQLPHVGRLKAPTSGGINDAINALVNAELSDELEANKLNELERWHLFEPRWTQEQFEEGGKPIAYWISLRPKYPNVA